MTHSHTNLLAKEHSPYLLQHQHNPVDWQPWGETAFAQARREDKPILLSIGYSTCHWCHVMERESFEDPKLAEYLNAHFISIKVDREERPDVDKIYMTAVQAMGLGGGWPLNAFLTPDLKPFYGGTYFPPEPRQGRPSFLQLLQRIHELWTTKRQDLNNSAEGLHNKLAQHLEREAPANAVFLTRQLQQAAQMFKGEYDPTNGGFGGAPKFPRVSQPFFLLHYGANYQDPEAVKMVLQTCEKMAAGGINDQLGGGFARYSVDAQWLVPHFEKMLYDNAQLLGLYLDAANLSTNPVFAATARHIVDYVLRDMTDPEGGFYSAEDADSEGKEGKFYCWTQTELAALLSPAEFKVAVKYFGITEHGNFLDHSDPNPLPNQNVLSIVSPALSDTELPLLNEAKKKLLKERAKRIRPHLDDKVLASWNGLMMGALARAAVILDHPAAAAAAQKNFAFIRTKLWDASTQTLHNRWRKSHRDDAQILDAYSFLLGGVIDLYETTLNPDTLAFAIDLADAMLKKFYDPQIGGFWQAPKGTKDLILNVKEDYDGAEPSGNSTAAYALLRLAAITERKNYREAAEKTLKLFYERCQQAPQILPLMLHAWDFSLKDPRRAVINGEFNSPEVKALLKAVHTSPGGHRVVLGTSGSVEPFAKTLPSGKPPKAFICTGNACLQPTADPETIRKNLR